MICPQCNAWTRTLETREKPGNQVYRRYECANIHRFSTMESVTIMPPKKSEEIREFLRQSSAGVAADVLAQHFDMPMHATRAKLKHMRDAYISHWKWRKNQWLAVWAVAESIRDKPADAPEPKGQP